MFDNGSEIKFLSCGDLKGIEHTYAYINEADEVAYEDFLEIKIRTQKSIIIDYNPSESDHWTYELRNQENSVVIHSTYLDNVFLPDAQVKEIEELIATDERAYKIYALGEYPAKEEKIYNHYKIVPDVPEYVRAKNNFVYGLDFGHSDPNALVKVWRHENEFWVEELLYKTGQDPNQLLESLDALGIDKKKPMLCDHRTDIIQLLRRAGYSALAANKLPIVQGIDFIRMNKFFVTMDSTNLKKELVGYSYKINRSTGQITDEPVDFNNHLLDAARYACVHYKNKGAGMMTSFRLL
jgi:phage terminase large subunit